MNSIMRALYKTTAAISLFLLSMLTFSSWCLADSKSEGSFIELYPTPFFQTTTGKASAIVGSAIVIGAITYFTAGTGTAASAGPIATWVGSHIGGIMGYTGIAATNAGLAIVGGGAIANGGLGVLGGIAVLNALGDVAIAFALEGATSRIPQKHDKYSILKIRMPDKGNVEVLQTLKKLNEIIEKFNETSVDPEFFRITTEKYHKEALEILKYIETSSKDKGQDYLLRAIIEYNMGMYKECEESLNLAEPYLVNCSVSYYIRSLLCLVDGDYKTSIENIKKAIEIEPEALIPHLLYVQILMDEELYYQAFKAAERGLKDADSDSFLLLLMAANLQFNYFNNYEKSLDFFKKALSNISINEMEAECKLMIAKSYKKLGNDKKAIKWFEKALDEVEENPEYAEIIMKGWNNNS